MLTGPTRYKAMVTLVLLSLLPHRQIQAQDANLQWETLNSQAEDAYRKGLPSATQLAQNALGVALQSFGERDRRTFVSINILGLLEKGQGHFDEATALYQRALAGRQELLGPQHPDTLQSMHNLAGLLQDEGLYDQAERLLREALLGRQKVLGPRHPQTLTSLNNLGLLLLDEGRFGEAEPLLREALQARRETRGERHPETLTSLNNLGLLLYREGRFDEAEPFLQEAYDTRSQVLGPLHPLTLLSLSNFAAILKHKSLATKSRRYSLQAEALYREALSRSRTTLGDKNPETLTILGNLAVFLDAEGAYGEAERLYRETLQGRRELLGPSHPSTLTTTNNLAKLLQATGRPGEAEGLLREALKAGRDSAALGPAHPITITIQLNLVGDLAAQGRLADAVALLRDTEPELLSRIGSELYMTADTRARQQLVASQSEYQDVALGLAMQPGAPSEATEVAALALLRFKTLAVEEEAYLTRLTHSGQDPRLRTIAEEISQLHARLARLFEVDGGGEQATSLAQQLDAKEHELGQLSRAYASQLQVRSASLQDLEARLPARSALLDLRQFHPVDIATGKRLERLHWAGVLIRPGGEILVRDLGSAADTDQRAKALLQGPEAGSTAAARAFYDQLLAPFASELSGLERFYVAPDGALYLVPFGLLREPDGRALLEGRDVRLLQTGRDLLRPTSDEARRGLVALGGIDFEHVPTAADGSPSEVPLACTSAPSPQVAELTAARAEGSQKADRLAYARTRAADDLRDGFGPLPGSRDEVEAVARQYCEARPDEPVEVDTAGRASKARLLRMEQAPRVLHLATHGFYRAPKEPADRPLLLSGIALAGANAALRDGGGPDGILSALEALDLNLDGTELVVLSACETAQGQIDYGEGVSGLVRALRTAGARQVLVTLRPVSDRGAAAFMRRFYGHWLGDTRGDAAAALRRAQQEYLDQTRAQARAGQVQPPHGGEPAGDAAVQGGGVAALGGGQAPGDRLDGRGGAPPGQPPAVEPADAAPAWASFVLIGG